AISAQQINYNVPGVSASTHLKLNGKVIAEMYLGKITKWNDPAIAALNPGVNLPSTTVVPVHRSDSSGDTFLFTSFLSAADSTDWTVSPGTSVSFPTVSTAIGATKNSGMLSACQHNTGCIAYIGISYLQKTAAANLGEAELANSSGAYELPTAATISAEAASYSSVPSNGVQSMIYGSAATGYPIVNFEYAIVLTNQSSSSKAGAIKDLLTWIISASGGAASSYLGPVNFNPLPASAASVATALINKIS
ncbi:MAG TPA: phosphate ABC transporter substrate-binding protein PstS, partial [Acidimicrobiales bacterium]|nr:phosphate ABC transporter substrate-binding protein PstS [Acidimicrobiales bacterium]